MNTPHRIIRSGSIGRSFPQPFRFRPPFPDSPAYQGSRYARLVRPVLQDLPTSGNCYPYVSSRIPGLFLARGPSAVFRFIISVVIDPLQSVVARRARPHVGIKILKSMPPLTDLNSTVVPLPLIFGWALTPPDHQIPDPAFRIRLWVQALQTTTGPGQPSQEAATKDLLFAPAFASAKPVRRTAGSHPFPASYHCEHRKRSSREIDGHLLGAERVGAFNRASHLPANSQLEYARPKLLQAYRTGDNHSSNHE